MGSLQGPIICPAVQAKQTGVCILPVNGSLVKAKLLKSGFLGCQGIKGARINVNHKLRGQQYKKVRCCYSSSSDDNGSMAENFSEDDEDYVNSSVVEAGKIFECAVGLVTSSLLAPVVLGGICSVPLLMFASLSFSHIVEVKCGSDGFIIKMRDGKHLRCVHNTPQGGHLLDYVPHPAIVLKMEDGTGLLLPIIVLEMPSVLLMAAIRNVNIARPTMYQIVKEMIDKMGYAVSLYLVILVLITIEYFGVSSIMAAICCIHFLLVQVKFVRVTKRVHEAYFALP
ncbi:hypothetical protein C3L33_11082, partial [Rhododendron williamsianum]